MHDKFLLNAIIENLLYSQTQSIDPQVSKLIEYVLEQGNEAPPTTTIFKIRLKLPDWMKKNKNNQSLITNEGIPIPEKNSNKPKTIEKNSHRPERIGKYKISLHKYKNNNEYAALNIYPFMLFNANEKIDASKIFRLEFNLKTKKPEYMGQGYLQDKNIGLSFIKIHFIRYTYRFKVVKSNNSNIPIDHIFSEIIVRNIKFI